MYASIKPTLRLLLTAIPLATASALPETLEPRTCSKLILPTNFYGISTTALDTTFDYGPYKPPTDPFFNFKVSQTSDGAQGLSEESDFIATYTGLPCKSSQSYTLEFFFDPISDYDYGGNTHVDIWRVDGDISRDINGKGTPTLNKMKNYALIYVGGFKMPGSEAEQVRKVFQVGGFACKEEVSFRVSISNNPVPLKSGVLIERDPTSAQNDPFQKDPFQISPSAALALGPPTVILPFIRYSKIPYPYYRNLPSK